MEQQVWSVQHARQSTLRPRVADPLKAGHHMPQWFQASKAAALRWWAFRAFLRNDSRIPTVPR